MLTGIKLESGETLACDKAVVAMGVWSTLLEDWGLGLAVPMEGVKSTSLVYQNMPQAVDEPFALFCNEDYRFDTHLEVYPRNSGEIYICGCGGSDYVKGDRLRKGAQLVRTTPYFVDKKLFVSVSKRNDTAKTKMTNKSISMLPPQGILGPTRFEYPAVVAYR